MITTEYGRAYESMGALVQDLRAKVAAIKAVYSACDTMPQSRREFDELADRVNVAITDDSLSEPRALELLHEVDAEGFALGILLFGKARLQAIVERRERQSPQPDCVGKEL